jgi:hypothetical protein
MLYYETQFGISEKGSAYYEKKLAEGKTKNTLENACHECFATLFGNPCLINIYY